MDVNNEHQDCDYMNYAGMLCILPGPVTFLQGWCLQIHLCTPRQMAAFTHKVLNLQSSLCPPLRFWAQLTLSVSALLSFNPAAPSAMLFRWHLELFFYCAYQGLPWMRETLDATWLPGTGPYLRAAMKLPGWWRVWWSGPVPSSTVTHTGKTNTWILLFLCISLHLSSQNRK